MVVLVCTMLVLIALGTPEIISTTACIAVKIVCSVGCGLCDVIYGFPGFVMYTQIPTISTSSTLVVDNLATVSQLDGHFGAHMQYIKLLKVWTHIRYHSDRGF